MITHFRSALVHVVLGLAVLAVALTLIPSGDSGVRPDDLALGLIAAASSVRAFRLTRGMVGRSALPWRLLATAAALFSGTALIAGSGLAGAAVAGDALLVVALGIPPLVCTLLAWQVWTSDWTKLLVDGSCVVLALLVVADVLVFSIPDRSAVLNALAIGYGALAVGLAGALGVESTRELRRSVSILIPGSAFLAIAVGLLGAGPDIPVLWQALGDVAIVLCLAAGVLAISVAPRSYPAADDVAARSPRVNPVALVVTWSAFGGLPIVLLVAMARGQQLTPWAVSGVALVVLLLTTHGSLRAGAANRLVADLVRSEEDLRELVEGSSAGIAIVDGTLRLQFTSPAARSQLGLPADGGPAVNLLDLIVPEDRTRVARELREGTGPTLLLRITGTGDDPTELEVTHQQRGGPQRRVLHLRDVTVRRRRERELERMAFTDHLTRLPNRAMLFQEMAHDRTAPTTHERSLLVLDLDGFKAVNDLAGHESGDQLLVEVGSRLRTVVRDRDLVCRLGGDEFAVVIEGSLTEAVEAAQRVVDVVSHPFRAGEWTFAIGASVGVAELRPGGGQLAFRDADTALRAAKRAGKGCVRVWDGCDDQDLSGIDITRALAEGTIELRYSVAGDPGRGERMMHTEPFWAYPSGAPLPPADLWAAAGREGCDAAVQTWMFAEATRQAASMPTVSLIALDLPAGHLQADQLVRDVRAALGASGLAPDRLSLVLTEEALLTSPASLAPALHELRALGVRICLDDFGMGRTLWSHLARVPLTSVRVDVPALGGRGDEAHTLKVVQAIVADATTFGLSVIAHGLDRGPLMDAIVASGARMVRSREDLQHVTLDRVRERLGLHTRSNPTLDGGPAPEGPRILTG